MRNRALHDALRDFALEAAALLSDDVRDGAELEFDVVDDGAGRGPALYRYSSRTDVFLRERWPRLRELPACARAAVELGAGASAWLRVNGLRGEQAEPALQAMLERLYEDATSFGLPEERFERVYADVEATLYRDVVRTQVLVPLAGVAIEAERVELGDGLSLVRGDRMDAPPEAVWPEDGAGEPAVLCLLERDFPADEQPTAAWAEERFRGLVTSLRLFKAGAVGLGAPGWRRTGDGRYAPVSMGGPVRARGGAWVLLGGEEADLREFVAALDGTAASGPVGWALARFEMGCERELDPEALSDYLLALRGLLEATTEAGEASLALRLAALCAEDGERRVVQRRMEAALALERFLMGGGGNLQAKIGSESPRELVAELERHLRALLRDVLCGYLDSDLKSLADDILLETTPEHLEIAARDLRAEPEPDTDEFEPVGEAELEPAPKAESRPPGPDEVSRPPGPEGVTRSDDWGPPGPELSASSDPRDYSAPV